MAKQKLNLLQLSSRGVTQTGTRPTKVMRRQLWDTELFGIVLDNMPHDLLRHAITPCGSSSANAAEDSSVNDRSSQQPFIHRSFRPVRNGHGPDMPALSNKIRNRPMIFPTL